MTKARCERLSPRLGLVCLGLLLVAPASLARAGETDGWSVVCGEAEPSDAPHCYVSFLAGDMGADAWLGVAVQRLNGPYEVQVTGNGTDFGRAEINLRGDTIIVTDYCYESYCVFVQADELVRQFRRGDGVDISLYDGRGAAAVQESVSLHGFTRALNSYLDRTSD